MSKVILTVSYEIYPEKREGFLSLMKTIKEKVSSKNICTYSIYEQIGRKNKFSEVYIFNTKEDYDKFDDQDEAFDELVDQVNAEFVKEGKVSSTQIIEVI
jgi:hypothetical protein